MGEAERLREVVWRSGWSELRQPLAAAARTQGSGIFLVGGHVRDLLLGRVPRDLDLTVEGDGVAFARRLAQSLDAELRVSERFLTAEIDLADGRRIDVATARSETYEYPGALPKVAPADLRRDLERRDFSVNTFALALAGTDEPELLAVDGARADLVAGRLRPLHPQSFSDDPTRLLRAVRQELELDFELTAGGEAMAREAVAAGALAAVSGERLWRDLKPPLSRVDRAAPALGRLQELGVLEGLLPGLGWSPAQDSYLERSFGEMERLAVDEQGADSAEGVTQVSLLALASGDTEYLGEALAERLHLGQRERAVLRRWPGHSSAARAVVVATDARPSAVHSVLDGLSISELSFLAGSLEGTGRAWVCREVGELRGIDLTLRPGDLLSRGHAAGPAIGRALERTLAARLDGEIGSEEELDYALGVLAGLSVGDLPRD